MCKFASFVVTKTSVFYGPTDSHSDIISHHDLIEDGCRGPNIERVELLPPEGEGADPRDLTTWTYILDQDVHAEWHEADPALTEERARAALARRAAEGLWFVEVLGQLATAGYRGTATAGNGGTATAGFRGTATAGNGGTLVLSYWDATACRKRLAIAYIGEAGIEPGVKYRLNDEHEFVRAEG